LHPGFFLKPGRGVELDLGNPQQGARVPKLTLSRHLIDEGLQLQMLTQNMGSSACAAQLNILAAVDTVDPSFCH